MSARNVLRWLLRASLLCLAVLIVFIMLLLPTGTSHDVTLAYMHAADAPGEAADREIAAAWRKDQFIVARNELVCAVLFGASLYGFFRLKPRYRPKNI